MINNFLDLDHRRSRSTWRLLAASERRSTRCRSDVSRQHRPQDLSLDAFEIGYTGVVAKGRAHLSAAFYVNWPRTTSSSRRTASTSRPSRRRTGRCRRSCIAASRRSRASSCRRCSPTRTSARPRARASRSGVNAQRHPLRRHIRELFVSGRADPPTFALSELNLPPNNRFNIGSTSPTTGSSATSTSPTPTALLAGRAQRPVSRHDRGLHDGQRRLRREVG